MFVPTIAVLLACGHGACARTAPALQEYLVDAGHSIVEFSIGFAFSRVKGRFTDTKGTILYDAENPERSSVTVVIETKSIDTGWPHRDEHLRTSDFFGVEKFPTITFQSERLTHTGDAWTAFGPLTMHGVTKQIAIPFRFLRPPTRSPESRWMIINVEGTMRLARKDFGILGGSTYNSWFNSARSATMADTVDISIELEGYSADAVSQRPPGVDAALERLKTGGVPAQLARLDSVMKANPKVERNAFFYGQDYVIRALVVSNRVREAEALSRALLDVFPGNANAHVVHAYVLDVNGDAKAAAAEYAVAKKEFRPTVRDPNEKFPQVDDRWWYLDQLARTSIDWGRTREAVPLARVIAELFPEIARAQTIYGLALASVGATGDAREAYARALSIDANETRALELRRRLR